MSKAWLRISLIWTEAERAPPKINKNRSTPQYIIVNLANSREKKGGILRVAKEKRFLMYRVKNIKIRSDLSTET